MFEQPGESRSGPRTPDTTPASSRPPVSSLPPAVELLDVPAPEPPDVPAALHPAVPVAPPAVPVLHPAVAALQAAAAGCAAVDSDALSAAVDVAALQRLAEQVQGLALRALGRFDATSGYAYASPELGTHPHVSAAAWLHQVTGLSLDDARGRTRLARRIAPGGDLAPLGELLAAGRTTVAHLGAVNRGLRGVSPQVVQEALPAICVLLEHLDPVTLARELRERAHAVSDDLAREQERRQRERRGFWFPRSTDGVAHPKGLLPALDADLVEEALARVMQRERAALDATGQPDKRDLAQRRADALVTLARHALTSDTVQTGGTGGTGETGETGQSSGPLVGAGGVRAAVTIVVTADRLAGVQGAAAARTTSSAQTVLSTGTLLELTCDADLSRVTLDTSAPADSLTARLRALAPSAFTAALLASPVVLDHGRTTRTVTPAQWRALVARDRHCTLAGCHRPASGCIAHHVQHWTRGGPSDLINYALVCHQHHHEIHTDDTLWHRHHDGRWLTPDGYRPPTTRPPDLRSTLKYPGPVSSGPPPF